MFDYCHRDWAKASEKLTDRLLGQVKLGCAPGSISLRHRWYTQVDNHVLQAVDEEVQELHKRLWCT